MSHGPAVAIVPLKRLDHAKGRLAAHLDGPQRRALVGWMLARVVAACQATPEIDRVLVVAGDEAAARLAATLGVDVVVERTPGLAAALAAADRETAVAPASLVVAADLPLAAAEDLAAVCRAGRQGPCVVVAPTRDGGTAALLRRPAGLIVPAYGTGSAAAHLQAAAAVGARGQRLEVSALAFDVDTAEDVGGLCDRDRAAAAWIRRLSGGRLAAYPSSGGSPTREQRACRRAR